MSARLKNNISYQKYFIKFSISHFGSIEFLKWRDIYRSSLDDKSNSPLNWYFFFLTFPFSLVARLMINVSDNESFSRRTNTFSCAVILDFKFRVLSLLITNIAHQYEGGQSPPSIFPLSLPSSCSHQSQDTRYWEQVKCEMIAPNYKLILKQ